MSIIGGIIVLIGMVLIVLPGPSIIVIPFGLAILATEYDVARKWLRFFQRKLKDTAHYLDRKFGW